MCLNPSFYLSLRDFSLRARVGELAQAITYSYWKWCGGYKIISDFATWMHANGLSIAPGGKSPDYVMFNPSMNNLTLMEAKGTCGNDHRNSMLAALRQCNAVRNHVPANNAFGCVLTFGMPNGPSSLHLRDPEKPAGFTDIQIYNLFRNSYASWFDFIGNQRLSSWCRAPFKGEPDIISKTSYESIPTHYSIEDSFTLQIVESLGFRHGVVHLEISPLVARALVDFEEFKRLDWKQLNVSDAESSNEEGSPLYFPDGTMILPK